MTEEEQQKCVSKAEVETHDEEKNSNNVCPRRKWRHITKGKQQQCVSGVRVETHDEEKTATMCVQGVSGDT